MSENLHRYLEDSTNQWPNKSAIEDADGNSITYQELDRLSDRMRDLLIAHGIKPGDRVGIWMRKSIDAVVAIFGVLKTGAAYVPLDATAPAARNNYILGDCAVVAAIVESRFIAALDLSQGEQGALRSIFPIEKPGDGTSLRAMLDQIQLQFNAQSPRAVLVQPDDLAFILYTSGSTGRPKGVQLSHRNALSFVEWCASTFDLTAADRFSSHAPFHFDLSVLDIFCAVKHGGTIILIGEELGKQPNELAQLIARSKVSIWYSAPSILSLIVQSGSLEHHDYSPLRFVLFAGEVFPITHLKSLTKCWLHPRYFNLYGPTETNVCTFYEVSTPIPEERAEPMPIGKVCSHLEGIVIDPDGQVVGRDVEGELCIRGPSVTRGYWNLPDQTWRCFVDVAGHAYYRTGDLVKEDSDGNLRFLGRKDRMIKKRGFRVELGEIEVCLYRHPSIREAAVVALADNTLGMRVHAHIVSEDGTKLSLIEMKTFCSKHIPVYMVPDEFSFHSSLPKTSTDKVDYQTLKSWSGG